MAKFEITYEVTYTVTEEVKDFDELEARKTALQTIMQRTNAIGDYQDSSVIDIQEFDE